MLSTKFQFVEFSLQEAALSRKRVAVPPDFLGLASDAGAEELLRASFQLVAKGDEISGENLLKRRDAIDSLYLVSISNYGKIIQHSNRADFDKAVDDLWEEHEARSGSHVKQKLNAAAIDGHPCRCDREAAPCCCGSYRRIAGAANTRVTCRMTCLAAAWNRSLNRRTETPTHTSTRLRFGLSTRTSLSRCSATRSSRRQPKRRDFSLPRCMRNTKQPQARA